MAIFMHATLKVEAYMVNEVVDVLINKLAPMFEDQGWKLQGCFVERFGAIKPAIITDIWEMEDISHVDSVMAGNAYRSDPRYLESLEVLKKGVIEESVRFMEKRGGLMKCFYS